MNVNLELPRLTVLMTRRTTASCLGFDTGFMLPCAASLWLLHPALSNLDCFYESRIWINRGKGYSHLIALLLFHYVVFFSVLFITIFLLCFINVISECVTCNDNYVWANVLLWKDGWVHAALLLLLNTLLCFHFLWRVQWN